MMPTIKDLKTKPIFLGIFIFVILPILTGGCQKKIEQEEFKLFVDKQNSQVTLHASQVPLSTILHKFEQDYQIKIVVPDFQDRSIDLVVEKKSLHHVLKQLLPKNQRYWIVAEKDDTHLKGSKGKKSGKKYGSRKNLPKKGDSKSAQLPSKTNLKVKPEKVTLFLAEGGRDRGTKGKPVSDRVISGKGLQDPGKKPEVAPTGRYLRLRFKLKDGKFTLEKTIVLRGTYHPPEFLRGKYIFSASYDNQVLAVGSFDDPLEVHTHFPEGDRPHEVLRAESATVDLDLPEIVLEKENVQKFQVEIFTLKEAPPLKKLNPKTFKQFEKYLRKIDVLPNQKIYEKLRIPLEGKLGERQ